VGGHDVVRVDSSDTRCVVLRTKKGKDEWMRSKVHRVGGPGAAQAMKATEGAGGEGMNAWTIGRRTKARGIKNEMRGMTKR